MEGIIKVGGVLCAALLLVCGAVIILQQHAVERHGLNLVTQTRAQMDQCKGLPSAELCDGRVWLYLLFYPKDRICFQVCSGPRDDPASREITTVPQEHVTNPKNYVSNLFERGYRFVQSWQDAPQWFIDLLGMVTK
jgi:hypothetical protein